MENAVKLGNTIKRKRLFLNLRMDDVASRVNITRATLWSIEKGEGNCSLNTLLKVLDVLGLSLELNSDTSKTKRNRATRINTLLDKKINRFIIMCVEQYSKSINEASGVVYKRMSERGVIDDLTNDYEDLHGMSTIYLNDYIDSFIGHQKSLDTQKTTSEYHSAKQILKVKITELIAKEYRMPIFKARDMLYSSDIIDLIDDDETGLYGESPLYVFSLFQKEQKDR